MIFSSDIRAWVSLLRAVAGGTERGRGSRETGRKKGHCERTKITQTDLFLPDCLIDPLAAPQAGLAAQLKLSRLPVLTGTRLWCHSVWQLYVCGLCFSINRLTLQHFHCHFYAGLGMRESMRSGLDHPAKGSWSESATWKTQKGSVGGDVNGAHGRSKRGKENLYV